MTKVNMDEAVRQIVVSNKSFKKQQEHMIALEAKEACLTTEVAKLLEVERKSMAKVDSLRKELLQMHKCLEDARLKLAEI